MTESQQTTKKRAEEAEELFHALVEHMHDGVAIIGWDGLISFANTAAAEMLDVASRDAMVGRHMTDFLHPDSVEKAVKALAAVKEGDSDALVEYQLLINGKTVDVESRASLVHFKGRSADMVVFRDVTQRKQAERRLQRSYEQLESEVRERTAEVKKSERMFRAMTESTQAMVMIASIKQNRAIYANPAAAAITGYSIDELCAAPPPTLFTEESEKEGMRQRDAFMRGEKVPKITTFELVTKSGEHKWLENTWEVLDLGEDGLHKVTVSFDVTERKQAERRLADSEQMYRTIFETTGTGTIIFGDDTIIRLANDEWVQMLGYKREEVEGKKSWTAFFTDESLTRMRKYHQLRSETPDAAPRVYEADAKARDGSVLNGIITISMVPGTDQRVGSFLDFTEIKNAQKEILESENKYRTIFENTGTSTIIFDNDAVIELSNDEWAKMVGYRRDEIEGKMSVMDFMPPEVLDEMKRNHAMRTNDPGSVPSSYETEVMDKSGRIHSGIVTIAMITGTTQRVGSFQDLTELKGAQNQMYRADKMAALGQIIAGVAHEINNPNNFIYFNLPILRKYLDGMCPILDKQLADDPNAKLMGMPYNTFLDDIYKLLDNMEHGSSRITSIVSDLKNYVRSDDSEQKVETELPLIVQQVMTLVGKQVRKMVKHFDVEIPSTLPRAKVNAGKIEQVLINLLVNAGQAADKDESWVKLTLRSPGSEFVEMVVADNGAGVPASIQDQIFEPFFTSKGRDAGTGLGLSISHKIIEDHGGSIRLESVEGEGSTFTVRLPIESQQSR